MMGTFGRLEGRDIDAVTLGLESGLQVEVLTYGAILRRLTYPVGGKRRDLILSLESLAQYVSDRAYVGSLVGRFGNRIAGSRFELDGMQHRVTANEGENHLHGGALGFGKRVWQLLDLEDSRLRLGLESPAGEEGYPGTLAASVELTVSASSLSIIITARTDAPSPVNLTYHPYFNLGGEPGVPATEHLLRIPAAHYLPVVKGLIPTGEIRPVQGGAFDFRQARRLKPPALESDRQLGLAGGYDHCWVLSPDADCACQLTSPNGDLTMTMLGSGPGLQFYNGQFLAKTHPALRSGVILEPQGFPDAVNQPHFPSAILRPGDSYRATIEYRFSTT